MSEELPSRRKLNHTTPFVARDAIYFVTICVREREGAPLLPMASGLLDDARYYQTQGKWFLYIFLVMPDHIHMLVHVPPERPLADVIAAWKRGVARRRGVGFQRDFFETRIRDAAHYAEKWNYICQNPVAKGLVSCPREWAWSIAFDRATGSERAHR